MSCAFRSESEILFGFCAALVVALLSAAPARAMNSAAFIENHGQQPDAVRFYVRASTVSVYCTEGALVFNLVKPRTDPLPAPGEPPSLLVDGISTATGIPGRREGCALYVQFESANPAPYIEGLSRLETRYNYFLGSESDRWITGVPAYSTVVYHDLWPGIDLVLRCDGERLAYEIVAEDAVDLTVVRMVYEGHSRILAESPSHRVIQTAAGQLTHFLPTVGSREGTFAWGGEGTRAYPPSPASPDVPQQLNWATYFGAEEFDHFAPVLHDPAGNLVLAGQTESAAFPTSPGAYDETYNGGGRDAAVAKLDPSGQSLIWCTFLGGSGFLVFGDLAQALVLDAEGNPIVAGQTESADFPTTPNAVDSSYNGGIDAFVTMLSSSGDSLIWSSFLGGSGHDQAAALFQDSEGNLVVSGYTGSSNFPTSPGAFDRTYNGNGDLFVTKLPPSGAMLVWSTFVGGNQTDSGRALPHTCGDVILVGSTRSADFPVSAGSFDTTFNSASSDYTDAFVCRMSSSGQSLLWSTFIGGTLNDATTYQVPDQAGDLVISGYTESSDFPVTEGAYDETINGDRDLFLLSIDLVGRDLHWSTYLGGEADDFPGIGLVLDDNENVLASGYTVSETFPVTGNAFDGTPNGEHDLFLVKISASGTGLLYGSYLGGSAGEYAPEINLADDGSVILTAYTVSADLPTTPAAYDDSYNGNGDAYILNFRFPDGATTLEPPANLQAAPLSAESIQVSWQDSATGESGFEIERKIGSFADYNPWEQVTSLGADVTEWQDSAVEEGTWYVYRARSWNATGYSPYSNHYSATPIDLPAAPSGLAATPISPIAVELTWQDNAQNEYGFEIARRFPGGEWASISSSPGANSVAFTDQSLSPAMDYEYRARAYNYYPSNWSNIAGATTLDQGSQFFSEIQVLLNSAPVTGAEVLVAQPGSAYFAPQLGLTDSYGRLTVDGLQVGCRIRAQKKVKVEKAIKPQHEAVGGAMYSLWLDSDVLQADGDYEAFLVVAAENSFQLSLVHPIFKYNLVGYAGWDIDADDPGFWDKLETCFRKASSYLYDVSDGQACLDTVVIYDPPTSFDMHHSDVLFLPYDFQPEAVRGAISHPDGGRIKTGKTISDGGGSRYSPDEPVYYHGMVHEFGHYAFAFYDEYRNGVGAVDEWLLYRWANPCLYPLNLGVMDGARDGPELSSWNDYPAWTPPFAWENSQQYWETGKPCWAQLEQMLEGFYPRIDVIPPPHGSYACEGSSEDRQGPSADVGSAMGWKINPPGMESKRDRIQDVFSGDLLVQSDGKPIPAAHVYVRNEKQLSYAGQANQAGEIRVPGLHEGDHLIVLASVDERITRADLPVASKSGPSTTIHIDVTPFIDPDRRNVRDDRPPRAAVNVVPVGTPSEPGLLLQIWPDEPLASVPDIVGYHGSSTDSLEAVFHPEENMYSAEFNLDGDTPIYQEDGLLEFTLVDTLGNEATYISRFTISRAAAGSLTALYSGYGDLQVIGENIGADQLAAASVTLLDPFQVPGDGHVPVSDVYSFHLGEDDEFPQGASLNISYPDSLLAGIDESSLVIKRWSPETRSWVEIGESVSMTSMNHISAPVPSGGTFCVFAAMTSQDEIAPAAIADLGAVGTQGAGYVSLDWTAPGDDGESGSVHEYVIAHSVTEFSESDWGSLPRIVLPGGSGPSGSEETTTLTMPVPGQLYYFGIRARDEAGNLAPVSNVTYAVSGLVNTNSRPGAPGRFRAVDRPEDLGNAILLSWELSSDDGAGKNTVEKYRIYRSLPPAEYPVIRDSVPAGISTYVDSTVVTGQEYTYWLGAADSLFQTFSASNSAFAAVNTGSPPGDFTSDTMVFLDDLSIFAGHFGLDVSHPSFDPLFDLDGSSDVDLGDLTILEAGYAPDLGPLFPSDGENEAARLIYEIVPAGDSTWNLILRVERTSNLAGYSMVISYPYDQLALVDATPGYPGTAGNFLNLNSGVTPLFLADASVQGYLVLADVIALPSALTAPEGDGYLARISFSGATGVGISISDAVFMDSQRKFNHPCATTGFEDQDSIPGRPQLLQNHPNPFNASTVITLHTVVRTQVSLKLYDIRGQLLRTLVDEVLAPGFHEVLWDGRDNGGRGVASGVYFYRLKMADFQKTRKMILIK